MKKTIGITPGYLRRSQAARYLGVSVRTLGEMQRRRAVPFSRMSARCVLFKLGDLDAAAARFRVEAIGAQS